MYLMFVIILLSTNTEEKLAYKHKRVDNRTVERIQQKQLASESNIFATNLSFVYDSGEFSDIRTIQHNNLTLFVYLIFTRYTFS